VLLSVNDCAWKLTDFGLTFEATSRIKYTTKYSRGTTGYRAVELLNTDKPFFAKASDIWALGCVFFELSYQKKAFLDDIAVWELHHEPHRFKDLHRLQVDGRTAACIRGLIHRTLEIDWGKRPTASDVLQLLDSLSKNSSNSVVYIRRSTPFPFLADEYRPKPHLS